MKTQGNTRKQRGQGMTEYVIIVALIAVAAIGVYSLFGRTVRNQTAGLAQEVAGVSAGTAIQNAGTAASTAQTNANVNKGLSNYDASNRP
jgi:pilus assembly protein Flp/PilA